MYALIDDAKSRHRVVKLYKCSHGSSDPHPAVTPSMRGTQPPLPHVLLSSLTVQCVVGGARLLSEQEPSTTIDHLKIASQITSQLTILSTSSASLIASA